MEMTEKIGGASTFLPDGEHFSDAYCEECQSFVKELCWLHATIVHDAPTVPLAIASLPDVLYFADNIQRGISVYAKRALRPHTVFGPLIAHGHTSSSVLSLDNDFCCNWMKFVSVVGRWEEPNLRLLLRDDHLVFVTVKVILPGEELKLAVEPRFMSQLDSNSCKPTRLADVHLHIPQGSLSLAETASEMQDNTCDVQNMLIEEVVEGLAVCASVSDAEEMTLPIETDPLVKQELPLDREGSPEYPFPSLFVRRLGPNLADISIRTDERCDSPIRRYPCRSRVAVDGETNDSGASEEALPIDSVVEEGGGMIADSDGDSDYRLSASGIPSGSPGMLTQRPVSDAALPPPLPVGLSLSDDIPPPLPANRLFSCSICTKNFKSTKSVGRHAVAFHQLGDERFGLCNTCGKRVNYSSRSGHVCKKKQ